MLVVIFGVSCVGKSTIIKTLIDRGYSPVRVYTTRQLRKDEQDGQVKIHISDDLFDQYNVQNTFTWVNQFFNIRYGTSQEDIENALSNDKIYLLDYALSQKSDFNGMDCLKIIVIPENLDSLIKQVESANRSERFQEILYDYHINYNQNILSDCLHLGYKLVINYYCEPRKATDQIERYIKKED